MVLIGQAPRLIGPDDTVLLRDADLLARFLHRPIVFQQPERVASPPSWLEHIPFAFWTVDALRPAVLVELGTHSGNSYASFAQAVQTLNLPTAAYAVDTWQGDPQAGFYDESVFEEWDAYHAHHFAAFSRLIRSTFDEAVHVFSDESIDLLHIDGYHTYDAVSADFETWRPKISRRGIVLLHDINVREGGFGVWRLWKELKERFPTFEFLHGHGLGVVALGSELPEALSWLCSSRDSPQDESAIRQFFSRLGAIISGRFAAATVERELRTNLGNSARRLGDAEAQLDERTHQLAGVQAKNDEVTRQLGEAEAAVGDRMRRIAAIEAEASALRAEMDAVRNAPTIIASLQSRLEDLLKEIETSAARQSEQSATISRMTEQLTLVREQLVHAWDERNESAAQTNRTRLQIDEVKDQLALQRREHERALNSQAQLAADLQRRLSEAAEQYEQLHLVNQRAQAESLLGPLLPAAAAAEERSATPAYRGEPVITPGWKRLRRARAISKILAEGLLPGLGKRGTARVLLMCLSRPSMLRAAYVIADSGLFDDEYYCRCYPDVAASRLTPLAHFLLDGGRLRNPHPLFDVGYYLRNNPDVASTRINPLVHYRLHGAREGRNPHPLFDSGYYLERYPDVAGAGTNPLVHFLSSGWREGRQAVAPPNDPPPEPEVLPVVEQPFYVYIDWPSSDGESLWNNLRLLGWAAGPSRVVRVDVLCDGAKLGSAQTGLERPDVVRDFPGLVDAASSGFAFELVPSQLSPGRHELAVTASDERERTTTSTRQVTVAEPQLHRSGNRSKIELHGKRPNCKRFALYTSSVGNYFFREIRDLIAAGLEDLGFMVEPRDERYGFADDADWHIVLAPHEFFYLGAGRGLLKEELPQRLIIVNTEQPSTSWFALASDCFSSAHSIWDISFDSARLLRSRGQACGYLALGYVPGFESAKEVERLPEHYGTCFLEPEIRNRSYLYLPLAERPIDVMFVGHPSRRRERFFAKAAPVLSHYRCHFHFSDASAPIIPGVNTCMDTATVMGLAQRTKILLNIHHGEDQYFEWQRIVMQGIWQRALVISEPCGMAPPFQAGVDFVEAHLDDIAETIDRYISTAEGISEASEIAKRGFGTLTEKCRLTDGLRDLILQLHDVPEFPGRFTESRLEARAHQRSDRKPVLSPDGVSERTLVSRKNRLDDSALDGRTAEVLSARQALLESNEVSDYEKRLLETIAVAVHPADDMYAPPGGARHYLGVGLSASRCIQEVLRSVGRTEAGDALLDFPCGYGRVLRFLRAMWPGAQITAGEVQVGALAFCQQAFSASAFLSNGSFSALSLPRTFDLIWSGSLITHLDEPTSVELLRFFYRHLSARGLCIFTSHGQRSAGWMRDKKVTYGLTTEGQEKVLAEFRATGFGYADYPSQSGYGISLASHARMTELTESIGDWNEVFHIESGWDDHQDVYAFARREES